MINLDIVMACHSSATLPNMD